MKYIINNVFDQIGNDKRMVLMSGNVNAIYILQEIEAIIWKSFTIPCTIDDAFMYGKSALGDIEVSRNDFDAFVEDLIDKELIIKAND